MLNHDIPKNGKAINRIKSKGDPIAISAVIGLLAFSLLSSCLAGCTAEQWNGTPAENNTGIPESISISQKTSDGYTYDVMYSVWDPVSPQTGNKYIHPGDDSFKCPVFDPEKDLVIPVRVLVTNTTEKFSLENIEDSTQMYGDILHATSDVPVSADFVTDFSGGIKTSHICIYGENGNVKIKKADAGGDEDAFPTGKTGKLEPNEGKKICSFFVIHDYYSPATPNGKIGLLKSVGFVADKKMLTLSKSIINLQ